MDKTSETKKCFCARCFLPVDPEDRVDIEGQNFHRICSTCCVCRMVPASLKMFYGHVFCSSCFKTHVLDRMKVDSKVHSNSWWMQWAPASKPSEGMKNDDVKPQTTSDELPKRSICARCLQQVDENCKVQIGDQSFHSQCAQCYFCHSVPTSNPKIYYGQVFCEDCFHRYVLSSNKDNPSEFFRSCFETWQNNTHFADNMRNFMSGNKESVPFVFMMQGPQPPFCRCGSGPQDYFQANEANKSAMATPASKSTEESLATVEISFDDMSELQESSAIDETANQDHLKVSAAEKIEKLTKYLHGRIVSSEEEYPKKWKNFNELHDVSTTSNVSYFGWINLQDSKVQKSEMKCPKCLWQYGPIFVDSDYLQEQVVSKNLNY